MNAIFLDFDGVLNQHEWRLKKTPWMEEEKVKLLSELCKTVNAKIVLSTTWRNVWFEPMFYKNETNAICKAHKLFEKYGLEIIGITETIGKREEEIFDFLKSHKEISNYVIFDDSVVVAPNFIQTDANIGLTKENIQAAMLIFKQ